MREEMCAIMREMHVALKEMEDTMNEQLVGELAFSHPNIGLEPKSQSFELNDYLDSAECKSRSEKVKENEKRISLGDEGNFVPRECDMEVENSLIASELVCPTGIVDLENDDEAMVQNFVIPVSHSSQEMEALNTKRSHDVSIHDSLEELDSCENSEDTYSDECVTESQPELVVCYKESNYHFVKDICVDEGVPATDNVWFENSVDEKDVFNFHPFDNLNNKVSKKDNINNSLPLPDVLDLAMMEGSDKVPTKHHQSEDLIQRDENATENLADPNKEVTLPGEPISLLEIDPEEAGHSLQKGDEIELNRAEVFCEPESHFKHRESESRVEEEEAVLENSAINEPDGDILVRDSNFVPLASGACCSKEECHHDGSCKCDDVQNAANLEDGKSITSQGSHRLGETSFSALGLVSSHICYSGPVPFSGSISLRSDSSTTSTRSFAFPILQSEWNSSPVRMAKADKRRCWRRKGWRDGLLCCRF